MSSTSTPQIYLITPPSLELSDFPNILSGVLDGTETAAVRLSLETSDEDLVRRAADVVREVCHTRDVALLIDRHYRLVTELGLDGVHLTDGARQIRDARKAIGKEGIVGAYCEQSRHSGMTAGEAGADYVSFGPLSNSGGLGTGETADPELFQWWSEMIEVPVVAEGGLTPATYRCIANFADFIAVGPEIWNAEAPANVLRDLVPEAD